MSKITSVVEEITSIVEEITPVVEEIIKNKGCFSFFKKKKKLSV